MDLPGIDVVYIQSSLTYFIEREKIKRLGERNIHE